MKKEFKIGIVLSIVGKVLLCEMSEIYDILNFMTNDNLFTHQLPRAAEYVKPFILKQYSQLLEYNCDNINTDNWKEKLDYWESIFGKSLELESCEYYESQDPIEELENMVGKEKVIVVQQKENNNINKISLN